MSAGEALAREAWLHAAVAALRPRFAVTGMPLPERMRLPVGFGYGVKAESKIILGQCQSRRASGGQGSHIFISPVDAYPAATLAILVHELGHRRRRLLVRAPRPVRRARSFRHSTPVSCNATA